MNNKGFIGSIGDDFPSLIPLFFGILLFFSTIGFALTTINQRNAYINTYIDSIKIAKTALGKGLISNYNQFEQIKRKIVGTSTYIVGLIYVDKNILYEEESFLSDFLTDITKDSFIKESEDCISFTKDNSIKIGSCLSDDYNYFVFSSPNLKDQLDDFDSIDLTDITKTNKFYSYIYPIGLYTKKGVLPVYLVVFVW